jgi:hypothetical protein
MNKYFISKLEIVQLTKSKNNMAKIIKEYIFYG